MGNNFVITMSYWPNLSCAPFFILGDLYAFTKLKLKSFHGVIEYEITSQSGPTIFILLPHVLSGVWPKGRVWNQEVATYFDSTPDGHKLLLLSISSIFIRLLRRLRHGCYHSRFSAHYVQPASRCHGLTTTYLLSFTSFPRSTCL